MENMEQDRENHAEHKDGKSEQVELETRRER